MDFPAQVGQLKTGLDGKGMFRSHLWCPNDHARLWDRCLLRHVTARDRTWGVPRAKMLISNLLDNPAQSSQGRWKYAPILCILPTHVLSVRPIIARCSEFCAPFSRFQLLKKM